MTITRGALRIADQGLAALKHSSAAQIAPKHEHGPPSRSIWSPPQVWSVREREAPDLGLDM
jgi:hypothetical protein